MRRFRKFRLLCQIESVTFVKLHETARLDKRIKFDVESLSWVNEQTGETGMTSRLTMYDFVTNQNGQAYVADSLGNKAYIGGAISAAGNKYVRTHADGEWTNNLLSLPECS